MLLVTLLACDRAPAPPLDPEVVAGLSMTRVKADVDWLASDDLGGRVPGSPGHDAAGDWVEGAMADAGLEPLADGYAIPEDIHIDRDHFMIDADGQVVAAPHDLTGVDYVGVLPGTDPALAGQYVVLMAHYDHLGVTENGAVYTGAFDDATAVAALIELARVLQEQHVAFRRSILFLITDAEEDHLAGSAAWVADPTVSLDDVAMAICIDPIGRPMLPDQWPLAAIGAERSPDVRAIFEEMQAWSPVPLVELNREPLTLFGGDQDSFWAASKPIPAVWIVSPGMTYYHQIEDRADTIDYRTVRDHLGVIAQLVARFGNDDQRYTDEGPKPVSVDDAAAAAALMDQVMASPELTDEERGSVATFRAVMQESVDAGEPQPDLQTTYAQAIIYLVATLAPAHPGPIPPPFPE